MKDRLKLYYVGFKWCFFLGLLKIINLLIRSCFLIIVELYLILKLISIFYIVY